MSDEFKLDVKLGKAEVKHDDRTKLLKNYLDESALPAIPRTFALPRRPHNWEMYENDKIGDCTCAAAGHMVTGWSYSSGKKLVPKVEDVIALYETQGYRPNDPSTDNGAYCLDVLNELRHNGLGGDKIDSYVKIDPRNISQVKAAIYLFGGVYLGMALPESAQYQDGHWTVTSGRGSEPGSWGGHCINAVGFGETAVRIVTWGQLWLVDWDFWSKYTDEAYAVISEDWLNARGTNFKGFDLNALRSDLQNL
jgi:hypothetical protein